MDNAVLEVVGLTKVFVRKDQADVVAVDDVSFCVAPGECVGLIGGSGSGKSTIARMVTGLAEPTKGKVLLGGSPIEEMRGARKKELVTRVQMVFQSPTSSFDPRRTLGQGAAEALRNLGASKSEANDLVRELFELCGLKPNIAQRYPHEVSGGQCQRAAIARALAPEPPLIVLDEATSALDTTVQAQVVGLLQNIAAKRDVSYLFICHDIALVQQFCDRVIVMNKGRVVEQGPTQSVIQKPGDPYTKALVGQAMAFCLGDVATTGKDAC